ncbi:MAG: hypothetical protein LCI00_20495 [Chloroflexi bacterium]|nr:hypothetical protein [Chloroflexota bacterium]MCC6892512.1 hypothetical protein [Anaerolineae bacterium]
MAFALHIRRIAPVNPLRRHPNGMAAAFSLTSAALAPFQRFQPSLPPPQNDHSADRSLTPASQFGG